MEQNIVIHIGMWNALSILAVVIGSVAAGAWRAATMLARVETKVDGFETRLTSLEGRLDRAFGSNSPIALLPKGQRILYRSGLKKYVDDNRSEMLAQCRAGGKMGNPYDIQEAAFRLFDQYKFGPFAENVKTAAFTYGVSIETIRRIAGIYFRDICLAEHGFTPEDLDNPHKDPALDVDSASEGA